MKRSFLFLLVTLISCSSQETQTFDRCAEELSQWPSYPYPYSNLPEEFAKLGKRSLLLFSYGSLMDVDSAKKSLSSKTVASRRPALGFGIKRIFNRDVSIKPLSSWGTPCDSNARAMLNVQPTEFPQEFVNGILIEIPLNEVCALLKREEGYDLIPIVAADWEDLVNEKVHCQIAYTLHATSDYTSQEIFPRPGYYEKTRDASAQFGPLFLLLWENTTYMADGNTPIALWEQWLKENDPRTCILQDK